MVPPDASIIVQLQDVTVEGTVGVPFGEVTLPASAIAGGRAEFSIAYDPAVLVETNAYAVVARVDTADARTILVSLEPVLVINDGAPTEGVRLALTPLQLPGGTPMSAASPASSPAPSVTPAG